MLRMIGTFVAGGVAAALLYPRLAGTVPSSAALDERPVALYTQKLIELQRRGEKFPRGKDAKEQVGALCLCSCAHETRCQNTDVRSIRERGQHG